MNHSTHWSEDNMPVAEINMVPLIDVMLVLLVIFLVTAPLLTHAVKVDLPQGRSAPNMAQPDSIAIAIDAKGDVFWNTQPVAALVLQQKLEQAARAEPQPQLQIHADRQTAYLHVAQLMSQAARMGITRMAFVTDPALP